MVSATMGSPCAFSAVRHCRPPSGVPVNLHSCRLVVCNVENDSGRSYRNEAGRPPPNLPLVRGRDFQRYRFQCYSRTDNCQGGSLIHWIRGAQKNPASSPFSPARPALADAYDTPEQFALAVPGFFMRQTGAAAYTTCPNLRGAAWNQGNPDAVCWGGGDFSPRLKRARWKIPISQDRSAACACWTWAITLRFRS